MFRCPICRNNIGMRPEVELFAGEMEKQLDKNEHKGGWGNCDRRFLLLELTKIITISKNFLCVSKDLAMFCGPSLFLKKAKKTFSAVAPTLPTLL